MFSVLILTKDEEKNIEECINSVNYSDDIVIFDSFSSDRTKEIGLKKGARIIERKFDNWSNHQNWALKNIKFKHKWVLYIDADERLSSDNFKELDYISKGKNKSNNVAFLIKREDYFFKKSISRTQKCNFIIRFFRPEFIFYKRLVNPIAIVDGFVGTLHKTKIRHFPFSKGISQWIDRHNSYSTFEAKEIISNLRSKKKFSVYKAFFGKNSLVRRQHQKEIFHSLPLKPYIQFIRLYFWQRGFLDGSAGLTYSILQSFYTYMIEIKVKEFLLEKDAFEK